MKRMSLSKIMISFMATMALMLSQISTIEAWQDAPGDPSPSFSAMYVFGDSLSDTGNFYDLTGQPGFPYYAGRYSNGPVWVEYLATALAIEDESFFNYAYGGATTGRDNVLDLPEYGIEFPGLHDEIDMFVVDLDGERADEDALYIVWAGANNFYADDFDPFQDIATAIRDTARAVRRLHSQGARHILVVNLPDLGLTPDGRNTDPEILSWLSAIYNSELEQALNGLAALGVETIRFDSSAGLTDIVDNKENYPPLTNVEDAFLPFYFFYTDEDPDEFLFWDSVHPTTTGHAFIAAKALEAILEYVE